MSDHPDKQAVEAIARVTQEDHDAAEKFVRDWDGAESIRGALAALLSQTRKLAREAERDAIVDDLLEQASIGADKANIHEPGSKSWTAMGGGSLALKRAAERYAANQHHEGEGR